MHLIASFDLEVTAGQNPNQKNRIIDIGAILSNESSFHKNNLKEFFNFISRADFLCGHNIICHDLVYIQKESGIEDWGMDKAIDTLMLSPLLFPRKPYHKLIKDGKLLTDENNNPLHDAKKAMELLYEEIDAFRVVPEELKLIYFNLLGPVNGFSCFFKLINYARVIDRLQLEKLIRTLFEGRFCENNHLSHIIQNQPVELAYTLALMHCSDENSITPGWVLHSYPGVEQVQFRLQDTPCITRCSYCNERLDPQKALEQFFELKTFRVFDGEALQEKAVQAAVNGQSILTVFPTGGGKSITFQLPALMSGRNTNALTVIISPLQSLMKDQVDNLEKNGITDAVTINGLLDPIERSKAIERVEDGSAKLLYIAPESLRSVTVDRLLRKRKIARFVIDEAHCFSSWGQDFRVDYLYIGDAIRRLQKDKQMEEPIPVSCFTATAKPKVIEDIQNYFREKLNLELELFRTSTSRKNLHYKIYQRNSEEEKYTQLRAIIESRNCPAIIYVSRTRQAFKLAERLNKDGLNARPYHGKMDKDEKTANQTAFMNGEVDIMVATSAFGMGVDKKDIGTVIHYDISDSLENYVQEAGRAGRDEKISANCAVLFNEDDLDKHFILLNQTKISSKEINQVWKAVKDLTKTRPKVSNSALEIARKAGWDDAIYEIETRVTTAIAALEDAGYLKRGLNMPRLFATSILSKTADEAISKINASDKLGPGQKEGAVRIVRKLFSTKHKKLNTGEEAESRVDYISDQLGMKKEEVIRIIEVLKEEGILAHTKDLTAFINKAENVNKSLTLVKQFGKIELALLDQLKEEEAAFHLKEINEVITRSGLEDGGSQKLKTILNFWAIKHYIKKENLDYSKHHVLICPLLKKEELRLKIEARLHLSTLITTHLYNKSKAIKPHDEGSENILVDFSVLELKEMAEKESGLFSTHFSLDDIEDALFYLSRINSIKIEGGFLVTYNRLTVERLESNNAKQYTKADYEKLDQYYQQKVQQIHIIGEYAKKMSVDYDAAIQFVDDYFGLNYSSFLRKYFPGSRKDEINKTLTPEKFRKLFGALSPKQLNIINDKDNPYIVVAAGPGSGKTMLLVHKLASLLLAEDIKQEQMLMLTFSRAAVTEFKKRLMGLIGNAAHYAEIKTFHSYCFDLLGRVGSLSQSATVVEDAIKKIKAGEIEISRITKTVLVIDEAQDMNETEFNLVCAIMEQNEGMRVILVGDDDQNIYGFRGANSQFMQSFIEEKGAKKYELIENYRSKANIVDFCNQWAGSIRLRLKQSPIYSIQSQNGEIQVVEYEGHQLITPLTAAIKKAEIRGSTCILTKTNEEAGLTAGLLTLLGLRAKLIQTNDSFALSNLYELRYFSGHLNADPGSPLINDEEWAMAIKRLQETHARSNKNTLVFQVIGSFETVNNKKKYKSDWKAFLAESKLEDFIQTDSETVFVSTIHKAKGREFDNVWVLLKDCQPRNDEERRQLYVAFTRARSLLNIHYNGRYLNDIHTDVLAYKQDENSYSEPEEINVLPGHKDVNLGYFEFVQDRVKNLQSGDVLMVKEDGLANKNGELILKYSLKFIQEIGEHKARGYHLKSARVNFLVYWMNPGTKKELLIVLPEITLEKSR